MGTSVVVSSLAGVGEFLPEEDGVFVRDRSEFVIRIAVGDVWECSEDRGSTKAFYASKLEE